MNFVNPLGLQREILSTYHRAWLVISSLLRHFYICHPWPPCSQLSPLSLYKESLSKVATGPRQEQEGVEGAESVGSGKMVSYKGQTFSCVPGWVTLSVYKGKRRR